MYLSFWLFLIISGLVFRKSKKIAFLQMAFVPLMFAVTTDRADYEGYLMLFQNLIGNVKNVFNGNILFNLLLYLFSFTKNYNIAMFFISIIMIIILYKAITYYTDNVAFVLSFYLIAPFVIDIVQVRNFIAMIIWFYFSKYLYQAYLGERKLYNICMYLFGVTIASGFHFSFVIMYVFVLIPWLKLKRILILSAILSILGTLFMYTNIIDFMVDVMSKINVVLLVQIVSKFHDYIVNFNYESAKTRFMLTLALYIFIIITLTVIYIIRKLTKHDKNNDIWEFLIAMDIASAIMFPFMSYSMEIYRVQRNLLLINYTLLGIFINNKLIHNGKMRVISVSMVIFCIVISSYYLYFDCIYWNYENVFASLFKL